jgi:RimJ/RimL family protein N-acetyltransferase
MHAAPERHAVAHRSNMQLTTARLVMRPFTARDHVAFLAIQTDPDINKFLHGRLLREAIDELERDGYGLLALTVATSGDIIGYGGLRSCGVGLGQDLQVLVGVLPKWRRQGLGNEALVEVIRWAFEELGRTRVLGVVRADNRESLCLLARLGASYVAEGEYSWPGEPPELVYEISPPSNDAQHGAPSDGASRRR